MKIKTSAGEFFDKITILFIKINKIDDLTKKHAAQTELSYLLKQQSSSLNNQQYKVLQQLHLTNQLLWFVEDQIRLKEKQKLFDDHFISLARLVYILNDIRFVHKNKLNLLLNSTLHEVKSYK